MASKGLNYRPEYARDMAKHEHQQQPEQEALEGLAPATKQQEMSPHLWNSINPKGTADRTHSMLGDGVTEPPKFQSQKQRRDVESGEDCCCLLCPLPGEHSETRPPMATKETECPGLAHHTLAYDLIPSGGQGDLLGAHTGSLSRTSALCGCLLEGDLATAEAPDLAALSGSPVSAPHR